MTGVYDASEDLTDVGDGEYERFPKERKGGCLSKLVGLVAVLLVVGLVAAGLAFVTYQKQVDPAGPPGAPIKVTIPLGSSTQAIGRLLDRKGVITSSQVFHYYTKLKGGGPFQAGEYTLNENMSMSEAIAKLSKGPQLKFERLTVREGLVLGQIGDAVATLDGRSKDAFLAAVASGQIQSKYKPPTVTTLEGLLLPETYNVEPKDTEATIAARMVASMEAVGDQVGLDDAQAKVGISPYEAIIVASLVERETRFDDERAKVAGVIYNRLHQGIPLGIDASIIYALGKSDQHDVRVLDKDLEIDSPYNTYRRKGLPPTPIAAPGRASLQAALNPEQTPYLYYVVTEKDGHHSFAKTLAEHNANIAKAKANGVR